MTDLLMKNLLKALPLAALLISSSAVAEETTIRVFDEEVFYDGYLVRNVPEDAADNGVLRNFTYLYSVKMTEDQLNKIGEHMRMDVFVKAFCDNYDRIGNINLALVEKGNEKYCVNHQEQTQEELPEQWQGVPEADMRIELGRFITPFMDKNEQPDTCPYTYDVDYLSYIFRDAALREKYDYWVEFELFGVPYAAQQQISGCEGCNSVFYGTLDFVTWDDPADLTSEDVLVPIYIKRPEYKGGNLNNYNATDVAGKCQRSFTFEVPEDTENAQIVLITSNHGANSNGEEYNRRAHTVYFDDDYVLGYIPGRDSCEPFRQYNTQLNGIYGYSEMSDAEWQSFSNWCPGDKIDNRIINLGPVKAGEHTLKIKVLGTKFPNQQGDIPISAFFQGLKHGSLAAVNFVKPDFATSISLNGNVCTVNVSDKQIYRIDVYDINCEHLLKVSNGNSFSTTQFSKGVYLVVAETLDGIVETHKVIF
jgi:hypothetical protein